MWANITDIPVKLLINNVLPFCGLKDVLSLGCTNKFFAQVANDDTFWRRRLANGYNFTGSEAARMSGWKFIYRKLRNPRVFVWGCATLSFFDFTSMFICSLMHSNALARLQLFRSRLGLSQFPETTFLDVPFPVELHLPGVRVISLAMSEQSVQIPFLISSNTPLSYCSCVPAALSTYLALTVVCMSVVRMPLIFSISC